MGPELLIFKLGNLIILKNSLNACVQHILQVLLLKIFRLDNLDKTSLKGVMGPASKTLFL